MPPLVFAACGGAAVIHASWNSVSRLVRGDMGVLFVGQLMSLVLLLAPLAVAFRDASRPVLAAWPQILLSGLIHAAYLWALNAACAYDDTTICGVHASGCVYVGTATNAPRPPQWVCLCGHVRSHRE